MEETLAILIGRRSWSETSWIVTWLTRDQGKVSTMARGAKQAKSPHAGKLDLFYLAEISYAVSMRSSLHTLREVRVIEPFANAPCANVFLAGYFAELTDLITQPAEPVEPVFDLLTRAIAFLRTSPASLRALEHFERELGRALGVESPNPLATLESYCGRIPASRHAAIRLMIR